MGRTVEPRSSRSSTIQPCSCSACSAEPPQSAPVASTSSATTTSETSALASMAFDNAHSALTSSLRRSVLPQSASTAAIDSSPVAANSSSSSRQTVAAVNNPRRQTDLTTFGDLSSGLEDIRSARLNGSDIRISRSARASWNAALRETPDVPNNSSMLPPRMGTPAPVDGDIDLGFSPARIALHTSAFTILPRRTSASALDEALDEALTTIGRRAIARHRLGTTDPVEPMSSLVHSLNLETLERAQLAVEGSRIALEQARLAIRTALRNSETRLGRLADLIRQQLQEDTQVRLPPVPASTESLELETERSEFNLERSLANLRAASTEIDRVLAASGASPSPVLPAETATSSLARHLQETAPQSDSAEDEYSIWNDVAQPTSPIVRQPLPRRPMRYLRPQQNGPPSNIRLRGSLVQDSISSRSPRALRPIGTRSSSIQLSLAGYVGDSTSGLARNVLTSLSSNTSLPDDETPLLFEENRASAQQRPFSIDRERDDTRARVAGGRWIRLDANGDEISIEDDPRAPLGWTWSSSSSTATDEEKPGNVSRTLRPSRMSDAVIHPPTEGSQAAFTGDLVGR